MLGVVWLMVGGSGRALIRTVRSDCPGAAETIQAEVKGLAFGDRSSPAPVHRHALRPAAVLQLSLDDDPPSSAAFATEF